MIKLVALISGSALVAVIVSLFVLIANAPKTKPSFPSHNRPKEVFIAPTAPQAATKETSLEQLRTCAHARVAAGDLLGFERSNRFSKKYFITDFTDEVERKLLQDLQSLSLETAHKSLCVIAQWLNRPCTKQFRARFYELSAFLWVKRHQPSFAREVTHIALQNCAPSELAKLKMTLAEACQISIQGDDADTLLELLPLLDELHVDALGPSRQTVCSNYLEDAKFHLEQSRLGEAKKRVRLVQLLDDTNHEAALIARTIDDRLQHGLWLSKNSPR